MSEHALDRRDFVFRLGTGAGIAAIAYQAAASLRSLVPNVSYDAPTTVKLAPVAEFPGGLKFLPDERLFVSASCLSKTASAATACAPASCCRYRWPVRIASCGSKSMRVSPIAS